MMGDAGQKVRAQHLGREAYLYVRQSTVRQVFENTESSERQYALRRRAVPTAPETVGLGAPPRCHVRGDSGTGSAGGEQVQIPLMSTTLPSSVREWMAGGRLPPGTHTSPAPLQERKSSPMA
jgi:hypothetical protein